MLRPSGGEKCRLIDVSSRRITFPGPQVSPSGEVKGERATNRETRPLTRRAAQAGPGSELFTKHETRITAFSRITAFVAVRFSVGARGVASPETAVRTTAPAGKPLFSSSLLFTIVHYCSPLFAIVHQKILSCASALVPPGRCFPARCGAAWAAMARHGRPPSPAPATRPVGFSRDSRHEPRITKHGIPHSCGDSRESNPNPGQQVFANHGFFSPWVRKGRTIRNLRPDRRARRPVAAFLRVVVRHGVAMARHGRPPSPAPATRPVRFSPAARHATWFFPVPPATPGRATPTRPTGFHESRNTRHGLYASLSNISTISRHFPAKKLPLCQSPQTIRIGNTAWWVFTKHET